MKDYKVSNLEMAETYGDVLAYETIEALNKRCIQIPKNMIGKYYGEKRPIWEEIEHLDMSQRMPKYYFIAWVEKDNTLKVLDEEDGYHYYGMHLFIVGYIDTMEEVFSTVDCIVQKRFDEHAQGFCL